MGPPGRGNDVRYCPHDVGRDRSPSQTGQNPQRQQKFQDRREGRRQDGYRKDSQPNQGHRTASERIGQGATEDQANRPTREGRGSQLARDGHRYFQVRCDLHQERRDNQDRAYGGKNGKRKHGHKPRFVHLSAARRCGMRCYFVRFLIEAVAAIVAGGSDLIGAGETHNARHGRWIQ